MELLPGPPAEPPRCFSHGLIPSMIYDQSSGDMDLLPTRRYGIRNGGPRSPDGPSNEAAWLEQQMARRQLLDIEWTVRGPPYEFRDNAPYYPYAHIGNPYGPARINYNATGVPDADATYQGTIYRVLDPGPGKNVVKYTIASCSGSDRMQASFFGHHEPVGHYGAVSSSDQSESVPLRSSEGGSVFAANIRASRSAQQSR